MKKVRFKKQYSDSEPRMAYELVSDAPMYKLDEKGHWCYSVKLLGLVPEYKMEITNDETDQPSIDVFVRLSNLSNK